MIRQVTIFLCERVSRMEKLVTSHKSVGGNVIENQCFFFVTIEGWKIFKKSSGKQLGHTCCVRKKSIAYSDQAIGR